MKDYKVFNDTSFDSSTHQDVVNVLERCRQNRTRIKLDYGHVETGQSWGETSDVTGYVGRSGGSIKIPLLIYNKRSYGGGAILDHCIIQIKESRGGRVLYQHPNYQPFKND